MVDFDFGAYADRRRELRQDRVWQQLNNEQVTTLQLRLPTVPSRLHGHVNNLLALHRRHARSAVTDAWIGVVS